MFASEIKEAEAASFASGPSLNTLVDNMSESDGVSYIYYNLGGAAKNINNCGYIKAEIHGTKRTTQIRL